MTRQMDKMNKNFDGFKGTISDTVAEALDPISKRIDKGNRRMDKMEMLHKREWELIKERLDRMEGKQNNVKQSGSGDTYAEKTALPAKPEKAEKSADSSWFWEARECLRLYPITGNTTELMLAGLDDLFSTN